MTASSGAGPGPLRVVATRADDRVAVDAWSRALDLLPGAERVRILRLRREEDRRRALAAAWLARRALSREVGVPPESLPLIRNAAGRPLLPDWAGDFNLSHSGAWAVCALVSCGRVGIDVQHLRGQGLDLARACCTAEELAVLQRLPPTEGRAGLLALWAIKEAVLKAAGVGLRVPPREVALVAQDALGSCPRLQAAPPVVGVDWQLWRPPFAVDHVLALAAGGAGAIAWAGAVERVPLAQVLPERPGG
jgi:phosphopantetheinyl transferase